MSAKLVAEDGLLKELVLSFEEGDHWVIGRDPDECQLLVEDPAASRKHALCRRTPEGIVIENISSTNPTLINDEELIEPRLLTDEDVVKIGDTVFRVYAQHPTHIEVITNGNEFSSEKILEQEEQPSDEEETSPEPILSPFEAAAESTSTPPPPTEEEQEDKAFETTLGDNESNINLANVNFDLLETGRWLLKVISGPNNGAEFAMQTGSFYILGTDPNTCDIVFYDNSVSRQHARITVTPEDELFIEDLNSRNQTRLEGEAISGKQPLPTNTIVSTGTTSFVVYDREGEMQTIISPLLPSIVKVLQQESAPAAAPAETKKEEAPIEAKKPSEPGYKPSHVLGSFILTAILLGLFAVFGIAIQSLFVQEPVQVVQTIDPIKALDEAFAPFPYVKYSFNKTTGRLLLVGHVLTATDRSQLLYNLQGLNFIKDIDDSGVIIDEYVWSEANQILSKSPEWKGVTVHSPAPGKFVLSGYLQSRKQAEQVWDYLTRNFPYIDLLDNKIVVEEDIVGAVSATVRNQGYQNVAVKMSNGELILTGSIPRGNKAAFAKVVDELKDIPGIRAVSNLTAEKAPSESVINVTDRYSVSGTSQSAGRINVIINGRILTVNDVLDGMRIKEITPNYILLEKDGVGFRIDYSR